MSVADASDAGRGAAHGPASREATDAELATAGRIDLIVDRLASATGIARRRWLLEVLGAALERCEPGSVAPAILERAAALGADVPTELRAGTPAPPPTHSVVLPVAGAGGLGLARRVVVSYELDAYVGEATLGAAARAAVADALALAVRHGRPRQAPERYRLAGIRPGALDGLEVDGASLGAAAFVSAVSSWSRRPVRPGTAVTGALEPSGQVRPVGALVAKLDALRVRPDVTRVIVPVAQRADARAHLASIEGASLEVLGVGDVDALLDAALEAAPAAPPDLDAAVQEARREFRQGWRGYAWPELRERLERLAEALPAGRPDLLVAVLTMAGAARSHLGEPDEARRVLLEARALAAANADAVPDEPLLHLERHLALTSLALGDLREARRAASRGIARARRARLRGELYRSLGTAGIVALAAGDPSAAERLQREALDIVHAHAPGECARTHAYLIEALGAARDVSQVRREMAEALSHAAGGRLDAAWLHTSYAGALVACGAHAEPAVLGAIGREPLPGLVARRHLARATVGACADDEVRCARALELLAQSPAAHVGLHARLRALASMNVAHEAELRVRLGRWDADAAARLDAALSTLPVYGRLPRLLGPRVTAVRDALAAGPRGFSRLARALGALVARASALSL
jgi:tetratricopeptide (TPR) repeat protein